MAYRCVHCSATYEDKSKELSEGCKCGSKFFFYMKNEKLKQLIAEEDSVSELTVKEKEQMEQDVREITGIEDEETPVFLDFESVMLVRPGKYLIDLHKLFAKDKPRVYKLEDGKYIIDLSLKTQPRSRK